MLVFKRGKREDTAVSERMSYYSKCGRYRVTSVRFSNGDATWQSCVWIDDVAFWDLLGTHRSRSAAEKRCNEHAG